MAWHYPFVVICHFGTCALYGTASGPSEDRVDCESRTRELAMWASARPEFPDRISAGMSYFASCVSLARPYDADWDQHRIIGRIVSGSADAPQIVVRADGQEHHHRPVDVDPRERREERNTADHPAR